MTGKYREPARRLSSAVGRNWMRSLAGTRFVSPVAGMYVLRAST